MILAALHLALLLLTLCALRRAPEGWEDGRGFHFGRKR